VVVVGFRWFVRLLIAAVCLFPRGTRADEERPAVLTVAQVKQRLDDIHRRLRAWSIEYQAAGAGLAYYTHRIIAARSPDTCFYFCSRGRCDFAWESDHVGRDWVNDVLQDGLLVSANRGTSWMPMNRQFTQFPLAPNETFPAKLQGELMFLAFGWWPFEKRMAPEIKDVGPCAIPAIIKSEKYVVRHYQQECGGHWCHILENPGGDRLWLDCTSSCVLIARELVEPKTAAIMQRLEYAGHYEADRGIWIPREIRNIIFDHNAATTELRQRHVVEGLIRILQVRLNDQVDPKVFKLPEWPPGELESFKDGTWKQTAPGGYEHMENLARWLRRTRVADELATNGTSTARDYIVISLCAAILLIAKLGSGSRRARQ
jgi:hypothetical protein